MRITLLEPGGGVDRSWGLSVGDAVNNTSLPQVADVASTAIATGMRRAAAVGPSKPGLPIVRAARRGQLDAAAALVLHLQADPELADPVTGETAADEAAGRGHGATAVFCRNIGVWLNDMVRVKGLPAPGFFPGALQLVCRGNAQTGEMYIGDAGIIRVCRVVLAHGSCGSDGDRGNHESNSGTADGGGESSGESSGGAGGSTSGKSTATPSLQRLFVIRNGLTSKCVPSIVRLAQGCAALNDINLRFNDIDAKGAELLAECLRTNTTVAKLALSFNSRIGDAGAVALAGALEHNTTLKVLTLGSCGVRDDGAVALASMLKKNTTLQDFALYRSALGRRGHAAFAEAFRTNTSLSDLCFHTFPPPFDDAIGAAHVEALTAVAASSPLVQLYFMSPLLGERTGRALSRLLGKSKSLERACFGCGVFSDKVVCGMARALEARAPDSTLRTLALEVLSQAPDADSDDPNDTAGLNTGGSGWMQTAQQCPGDAAAAALAKMLLVHPSLEKLRVVHNNFSDAAAEGFAKVIKAGTPLRSLDLEHNQFTAPGIAALMLAVQPPGTRVNMVSVESNQVANDDRQSWRMLNKQYRRLESETDFWYGN